MFGVYIASPYTIGDNFVNVQRQIEAANKLLDAGLVPYAPLVMSAFLHMQKERKPDEWMEYDYHWLDRCEVLLRLDGKSDGGDKEVARALNNHIIVYTDTGKLPADYISGLLERIINRDYGACHIAEAM
jgi:hypothetical protein